MLPEDAAMNRWTRPLLACLIASAALPAAAQAEAPPLDATSLARCATQVLSLRQESARLIQKNTVLDQRRTQINQRSDAFDAERAALDPDDLNAGLNYRQRLKQHQSETLAFNAQIEAYKDEVRSINTVKQDYDRNCANRSYRRADLEAMPESARNAMRRGLSDVQVPYLD